MLNISRNDYNQLARSLDLNGILDTYVGHSYGRDQVYSITLVYAIAANAMKYQTLLSINIYIIYKYDNN